MHWNYDGRGAAASSNGWSWHDVAAHWTDWTWHDAATAPRGWRWHEATEDWNWNENSWSACQRDSASADRIGSQSNPGLDDSPAQLDLDCKRDCLKDFLATCQAAVGIDKCQWSMESNNDSVVVSTSQNGFVIYSGPELLLGSLHEDRIVRARIPSCTRIVVRSDGYAYCAESCIIWKGGQAAYCHTGTDKNLEKLIDIAFRAGLSGPAVGVWHRRQSDAHKNKVYDLALGETEEEFSAFVAKVLQNCGMHDSQTEISIKSPQRNPNHGNGYWSVEIQSHGAKPKLAGSCCR